MAIAQMRSRAIQLFEPPADAVYTIDATCRLVDIPRRTILVYCKHHLLSPATVTVDHGYYFDSDAIRTLRRIEALRTVCGDDFAGIKIILDLTKELEHLQAGAPKTDAGGGGQDVDSLIRRRRGFSK